MFDKYQTSNVTVTRVVRRLSLLELPNYLALSLYFAIPILMIVFSYLIYRISDKESPNKIRCYLVRLIEPVKLDTLSDEKLSQLADEEKRGYLKEELGLRLAVVYLALGVFILCNMIGTYYYIMGDLIETITQGSTGLERTWSSLVINTPFSGGWYGSLPWYGHSLLPPLGSDTFHDVWSWVFFTSAITDNPDFIPSFFPGYTLTTMVIGASFLVPLLHRSFRESFVPSLFLFNTGMLTITSSLFSCFARAWQIQFGSISIRFGLFEVSAEEFGDLPMQVVSTYFPVISILFLAFLGLGWLLGRVHYREQKKSHILFVLYIAATYWLSLFFTMLL
jgi:hypothetical protein